MRKTNRVTISLDDQDYAAIDMLARRGDVSLSWVIRHAIQSYIKDQGVQQDLPLPLHEPQTVRRVAGAR